MKLWVTACTIAPVECCFELTLFQCFRSKGGRSGSVVASSAILPCFCLHYWQGQSLPPLGCLHNTYSNGQSFDCFAWLQLSGVSTPLTLRSSPAVMSHHRTWFKRALIPAMALLRASTCSYSKRACLCFDLIIFNASQSAAALLQFFMLL